MVLVSGCGEEEPTNEIEEWDYKIYEEYMDESCYDYCIETNNQSFCNNACYKIVRKLYGDSYCNITCYDNQSFIMDLTLENKDTAIPASYLIITKNCSYRCYGEFIGWSD